MAADLTPEQKTIVQNLFIQQVSTGAVTWKAANGILKDLGISLIYNPGTVFFPKDGGSKFLGIKRADGKIQEYNWYDGILGFVFLTLEAFQAAHPGFSFKPVNDGWEVGKPAPQLASVPNPITFSDDQASTGVGPPPGWPTGV